MANTFFSYSSRNTGSGGGGGGGVTSLNSLTGALTLAAGSGISLTPSGSTLTIDATGGPFAAIDLSNITNNSGATTITSSTSMTISAGPGTFTVQGSLFQIDTSTFDAGNNVITSVVDPVNPQDAATKNYVDQHGGGGLSAQILTFTTDGAAGGDTSETFNVTGLLASDTIISVTPATTADPGNAAGCGGFSGQADSSLTIDSAGSIPLSAGDTYIVSVQRGGAGSFAAIDLSNVTTNASSTNLQSNANFTIGANASTGELTLQGVRLQVDTSTFDAGNNIITSVMDPQSPTDAANKEYVDAKVMVFTSSPSSGGSNSETLTVTGLVASTDTIISVTQQTPGSNNVAMTGFSSLADNSLTIHWTADPGAGAVVIVNISR